MTEDALRLVLSNMTEKEIAGRTGIVAIRAFEHSNCYSEPAVYGTLTFEQFREKCGFAMEKLSRLLQTGNVSSYIGRDPDAGKWGGAIRLGEHYLAHSGQIEWADESVGLVKGCWGGIVKPDDDLVREILSLSGNTIFPKIPVDRLKRRI